MFKGVISLFTKLDNIIDKILQVTVRLSDDK